MTAFNSFSHGTQDIYPTFLQVQQKYPPQVVSTIAVIYNLGAILGGLVFGAFSEHLGRRRAIVVAALLTLRSFRFGLFQITSSCFPLARF
jgi:MFS transporter, SHS family, lactate transporter